MQDTIQQHLAGIASSGDRGALATLLKHIGGRLSCVALSTAGLVIKAGGGVLAKTGAAASYYSVNGKLVTIAGSTDMPALTGINIGAGAFRIVGFFVSQAGTVVAKAGASGATLGAATWPDAPPDQALVGALVITYASAFTGGTTALDTATTVYLSPVGAVDPSVIFS